MDKDKIKVLKSLYDLCDITQQVNMLDDLYSEGSISKKEYDSIHMHCMKQDHDRLRRA